MCFYSFETTGHTNMKLGVIDHLSGVNVIRDLMTLQWQLNIFFLFCVSWQKKAFVA